MNFSFTEKDFRGCSTLNFFVTTINIKLSNWFLCSYLCSAPMLFDRLNEYF